MMRRLRVLHLEDDPLDAEIVQSNLQEAGIDCEITVVATRSEFVAALEKGAIDLILADFALPGFDGMAALAIAREMRSDLPFVFVSGRLGEEAAIDSLKNGATDYVLKQRLARLVPAVKRALAEAAERAELRVAEIKLARALAEISERAESYQDLFSSIRDVIVVTDHERRIVHANQPALRETFGYELEDVIAESVRILYADEEGFEFTGREIFNLTDPGKGKLIELKFLRKSGELFIGELSAMKRLDSSGTPTGNIGIIRDISERKRAEEALRESEMRSYVLETELTWAAEVQAKLLPRSYPQVPGFDIAARCLPAKHVGGDFFDWQEIASGVWSLTLGDVMGKGMAAAMLMATVRAALRSVAHHHPAKTLRLVERAVLPDLENAESFVTLFHAQLVAGKAALSFVDCGHGFVFMMRRNGEVETLSPRGLPLGVPGAVDFSEGNLGFGEGDTLVIFSDGLIDARPELSLNNLLLARHISTAATASEMVARLLALTVTEGPIPDDVTIVVIRRTITP